jgi:hypothetical protein
MLTLSLYAFVEHPSERLPSTEIRLVRDARGVPVVQQGAIDADRREGFEFSDIILFELYYWYFDARDFVQDGHHNDDEAAVAVQLLLPPCPSICCSASDFPVASANSSLRFDSGLDSQHGQ